MKLRQAKKVISHPLDLREVRKHTWQKATKKLRVPYVSQKTLRALVALDMDDRMRASTKQSNLELAS